MPEYKIFDIVKIVNGKLNGGENTLIRYISIDSRTVTSPSGTLFFALVGERHNGHNFLPELIKKNIRNFVVSSIPLDIQDCSDCNFIVVENTLDALHKLCIFHRIQFKIPVLGITGSNGKTIIKEWIFELLKNDKIITRSPKSYNSQVGVPLSVWSLDSNSEFAIFEAGISKINEMGKLQKIIQPQFGIFSNIGAAHQENFNDIVQKINEKLKLFYNSELLIYCKDYTYLDEQIKLNTHLSNINLFTWSKKPGVDLQITNIEILKEKLQTQLNAIYRQQNISINIPFTDDASIENIIHCWCFMLSMGYDNKIIFERMRHLSHVAMRLELKDGINNCKIIDDSYNSDFNSLIIAIDFLNQQNQFSFKTVILSDILQSGKNEDLLYNEVCSLVNRKSIDRIIGIGKAISRHASCFNITKKFYETTDEFLNNLPLLKFSNQAILIKGARKFGFERISAALQHKKHETVLEINYNAIIQNLNYFRSLIRTDTKVMVIVKAFSYGSGIFEIANLLQFQRVDYLSVAFTDEGAELRNSGIGIPIMVMNPEISSINTLIDYNLEPVIYNFRTLKLFIESIKSLGKKEYPVHIKIDTGMHRLGFSEDETDLLISELKNTHLVYVKSIYSHLAASEDEKNDEFTLNQIWLFEKLTDKISKELNYPYTRHILNSAGIERFPEFQFDMVRIGIGLYGISAIDETKLMNVSTLRSSISQIRKLKANETVGYNRNGKLNRDSEIAVVPIGYADGLNRRFGNGTGKVLIKDQLVPIIGNICMDMCMIDVTGLKVMEGDEVIIFGDNYRISELAKQIDTIPYEILTGISQRVKRVYFYE